MTSKLTSRLEAPALQQAHQPQELLQPLAVSPILKWQLEQIVKELLLLQGHASDPTCPCDTEGEFCVRKHLLMIEALAQETVPIAIDGEQKESLAKLASEARTQRNEEELSLCRPDEAGPDLVDWSRQWRKEFEEVSIACPVPGAVEATLYRIDLQDDEVATACEMVSSPYRELVIFFQLADQERLLFDTEKGEKKGKIDEIMQKLQQGVKEIWESTNYQDYLLTMAKFHHYSLGNIMLILMQCPDATRVAGFNRWRELERQVKKGEKGIAILAPCWQGAGKRAVLSEVAPGTKVRIGSLEVLVGQRVNGNIAVTEMDTGAVNHFPSDTLVTIVTMEAMTGSPIYFKVVYVFDIKQTEGKELPTWEVPTLTAEVSEELWQKVLDFTASKKVTLSFEPKPDQDPEIKGWCNMTTGEIWIKPDEPRAQQTKTLIHEDAHHLTGLVPGLAEKDHETIAESVAFVVSAHFGFDTGVRSFPYVAVWAREAEVLKRNLEAVRKLSAQMIDEMETLHRREINVYCPECGAHVASYAPSKQLRVFTPILECPACGHRFKPVMKDREPMAAPYPTGCELADLIRDSCHTESPWRGPKACNAYITELFGQVCRGHAPGSSLATAKLSRREAAVSENPEPLFKPSSYGPFMRFVCGDNQDGWALTPPSVGSFTLLRWKKGYVDPRSKPRVFGSKEAAYEAIRELCQQKGLPIPEYALDVAVPELVEAVWCEAEHSQTFTRRDPGTVEDVFAKLGKALEDEEEFELHDIDEEWGESEIKYGMAVNVDFLLEREGLKPEGGRASIPEGGYTYELEKGEFTFAGNFDIFDRSGHNIIANGSVVGMGDFWPESGTIKLMEITINITYATGYDKVGKPLRFFSRKKQPISPVHHIALSPCEFDHGLADKLDRCVTSVQERNVEAGCPEEGRGTAECPNAFAVCRASISVPVCGLLTKAR